MIEPKDKERSHGKMIYVCRQGSFYLNTIWIEISRSIYLIPWIKMDKIWSAFAHKRELTRGEDHLWSLLHLTGSVITITILCFLVIFKVWKFLYVQSLKALNICILCAFMLILFLCKRWTWQFNEWIIVDILWNIEVQRKSLVKSLPTTSRPWFHYSLYLQLNKWGKPKFPYICIN